mmetsp:Transcript_76482/g.168970  ORF Transcript_76482/g.168970 Transcript_76482/m.168970 type:complete len:318 (+) Transcript_76482:2-955(+)
MAMLTGSLCRAFSSTTPRFGARLAPLLGRKSSRWWQRLERNGGDGGEGCKAGVAHLKTLQLSWEIHGEGTPTVVITPRGQLDLSAARALASALVDLAGISVLIWDRRGSGGSSVWAPLTEPSMPEEEVQDLKLLLDWAEFGEPISLLGLSSGARLSAMFASRYPKRVSKLAVLPTGDAAGASGLLAQAYYGDCWELAQKGGMEAIVNTPGSQFQAQAAGCEEKRAALLSVDSKYFMNAMMNSQVFLEGFTGEAFLGLFPEALRQLEVPALIFHHGLADDRLHALEDAQSVAQDIPEGQLLVEVEIPALHAQLAAFLR